MVDSQERVELVRPASEPAALDPCEAGVSVSALPPCLDWNVPLYGAMIHHQDGRRAARVAVYGTAAHNLQVYIHVLQDRLAPSSDPLVVKIACFTATVSKKLYA